MMPLRGHICNICYIGWVRPISALICRWPSGCYTFCVAFNQFGKGCCLLLVFQYHNCFFPVCRWLNIAIGKEPVFLTSATTPCLPIVSSLFTGSIPTTCSEFPVVAGNCLIFKLVCRSWCAAGEPPMLSRAAPSEPFQSIESRPHVIGTCVSDKRELHHLLHVAWKHAIRCSRLSAPHLFRSTTADVEANFFSINWFKMTFHKLPRQYSHHSLWFRPLRRQPFEGRYYYSCIGRFPPQSGNDVVVFGCEIDGRKVVWDLDGPKEDDVSIGVEVCEMTSWIDWFEKNLSERLLSSTETKVLKRF